MKFSNDEFLWSKKIYASNIPGVQYYLRIYPNGSDEESLGEVCIFLFVDIGNESKVKADGKFCIDSANCADELDYEYLKTEIYGFSPCKTADFFDSKQKFIVDGKLIVTFEGILSVEKPRTENEINLGTGNLGSLFWMKENKDFTIHVGENAVKVGFTLLQCYVLYIYIFRSINAYSLFIPLFLNQCSKLA